MFDTCFILGTAANPVRIDVNMNGSYWVLKKVLHTRN